MQREVARLAKRDRIIAFIGKDDVSKAEKLWKLLKSSLYITEAIVLATYRWASQNNVVLMCVPVESDWQLIYLEMRGVTSVSLTEDSSFFAFRLKTMLINYNASSEMGL